LSGFGKSSGPNGPYTTSANQLQNLAKAFQGQPVQIARHELVADVFEDVRHVVRKFQDQAVFGEGLIAHNFRTVLFNFRLPDPVENG
jgi:hypothetical protein